mmetsp:Transcript_78245/g.172669  ORF Transcript_78245/g.172669 Transcript_78245/m.172669 type:complete len:216 (+) Transcript_78245:366-1013(+)
MKISSEILCHDSLANPAAIPSDASSKPGTRTTCAVKKPKAANMALPCLSSASRRRRNHLSSSLISRLLGSNSVLMPNPSPTRPRSPPEKPIRGTMLRTGFHTSLVAIPKGSKKPKLFKTPTCFETSNDAEQLGASAGASLVNSFFFVEARAVFFDLPRKMTAGERKIGEARPARFTRGERYGRSGGTGPGFAQLTWCACGRTWPFPIGRIAPCLG